MASATKNRAAAAVEAVANHVAPPAPPARITEPGSAQATNGTSLRAMMESVFTELLARQAPAAVTAATTVEAAPKAPKRKGNSASVHTPSPSTYTRGVAHMEGDIVVVRFRPGGATKPSSSGKSVILATGTAKMDGGVSVQFTCYRTAR